MPEAVEEREADTNLQKLSMLANMQRKINEYVTTNGELIGDLFPKNEFVDDEQKKSVAEGLEVWEAATPMVAAEAAWGMTLTGVVNMLVACGIARATMLIAV